MVRAKTDDLGQRRNFFKGPRLHYLSLRGAFSFVLRRLIANVGARAVVASLQIDLHRTTVNRWRRVFHACLVSSWRTWYEQMRQDMTARLDDDSEGEHVSRFKVHVARGDATNSRQMAKIRRSAVWRPTLFIQFGENTSHVERHIEEDEIRVDSQLRPAGCQSGLHWPGSHHDERQMGCNKQR